jgi:hypothetical protein
MHFIIVLCSAIIILTLGFYFYGHLMISKIALTLKIAELPAVGGRYKQSGYQSDT